MIELPVVDKARIFIKAATGEEWGDGYIVTDLCIGYAEPGYGSDEDVVVFGNWNPKRFPMGDDKPLTKDERLAPRLADALDKIGAHIEWLDEWVTCDNCYRAFRSQPDSYSWKMYGVYQDGYVCADCINEDLESYLDEYINNPSNALTFGTSADLINLGFEPYNGVSYENGWHPGQTDDPKNILNEIHMHEPEAEVIFRFDEQSQFYVRFSAYVRTPKVEDAES